MYFIHLYVYLYWKNDTTRLLDSLLDTIYLVKSLSVHFTFLYLFFFMLLTLLGLKLYNKQGFPTKKVNDILKFGFDSISL